MIENTKTQIVFDALPRENNHCLSLNNVMKVGPVLQNNIWDVLVRNRIYPIFLTGVMKQAFFQICIRELDTNALQFSWIKAKDSEQVETLRFTRAIFGLGEFSFLLNATIRKPYTLTTS